MTVERILSALEQAMQAESDGYYFYQMAASKTKDKKGKSALLALAQDELDHFEYLKTQHDALVKTGVPAVKMKLPSSKTGISPIFSKDFKKRLGKAHYEMSSLSIAIGLELSSLTFYHHQADTIEDPILKDFFYKLAKWEEGHHQMLVKEQARLQEEYWIENNFYPF